jgi:serine/threonine protein kinase
MYARGKNGYRPPELLRREGVFNKKSDIWTFGCLLFKLCIGWTPFPDDFSTRLFYEQADGVTVQLPVIVGLEKTGALEKLLEGCLKKDPQVRPKAREVKEVLATMMEEWAR